MPRTRNVAIVGANKEGLALLPILDRDPTVKVRLIADRNPDALVFKLDALGYQLASKYQVRVASSLEALAEEPLVDLVIDASHDPDTAVEIQACKPPRATVMSSLSARLLWGTRDPGAGETDRSAERQSALLTGLGEIIGAVNLAANQEELLGLVLSVAIESTGADRGSLLLLDPDEQVLRVRVAEGIPPEVIATIRVPLGEGISGKVAREGKPLRISGPANPALTGAHHVREDVAAALCVPLRAAAPHGEGKVVGVLNVHHRTDPEAFSDADFGFLMRLASLEAQIISRSQEFARLKGVAARFDTYRELRERLDGDGPLGDRLDAVCRAAAARLPGGTCTVHRHDPGAELLVVEGTSQAGAGAPWSRGARMSLGQGIEGAVARDGRERKLLDAGGGGTVLASPLVARGAVEGVLVLTATEGGDAAALELARELKPLLGEALRRDREQAAAAGKATKLAAMAEAGLAILGTRTPDELARVVAASAAMILEADMAIVRLREEGGRFPVKGAYGLPEESGARRDRLAAEQEVAGRATRERQPAREGNWLACPLLVDGRIVGAITVGDKVADDPFRPGPFAPADQEILVRLGAYLEQSLKERLARLPGPPPAAPPGTGRPATAPTSPAGAAAPARPNGSGRAGDEAQAGRGARYLSKRLADELARSRRNGRHVAVIVARVEPQAQLAAAGPATLDPIMTSLEGLFRSLLRTYDEVVRVAPTRLAVLLPDTEDGARGVAERLAQAAEADGVGEVLANARVRLAVGVAQAPDDLPPGPVKDREGARALIERASRV